MHDGNAFPDYPVKKRGFSDVRPSYNCNNFFHSVWCGHNIPDNKKYKEKPSENRGMNLAQNAKCKYQVVKRRAKKPAEINNFLRQLLKSIN